MRFVLFLFLGTVVSFARVQANDGQVFQGNGIKIGEMTQTREIVWTRLTARSDLNLPGIQWPQTKKPGGNSLIPGRVLPVFLLFR